MKRIILFVSLVFISLFIYSCEKQQTAVFVDGPFEEGRRGMTTTDWPKETVESVSWYTSDKYLHRNDEVTKINVYFSQPFFNEENNYQGNNFFKRYVVETEHIEYLPIISRIEVSFFATAFGDDPNILDSRTYLTEYMDISHYPTTILGFIEHNEYNVTPNNTPLTLHLNPINKQGYQILIEIRLTLSEELKNSEYFGTTFSPKFAMEFKGEETIITMSYYYLNYYYIENLGCNYLYYTPDFFQNRKYKLAK